MPFYHIESNPHPKDIQFLGDQIIAFNITATGITDGELLAVFLLNAKHEIIACVYG